MKRDRRVGWLVLGGVVAFAVLRAATAEHPAPKNRLNEADRVSVGKAAAALEAGWRREGRRSFPGDLWSQDDDFAARERRWAIDEARRRGVPVSDVLQAIDEELRAHAPVPPPREATVAPSKPRPFYD